jgi:DNA uptake protein ComE-like DNA-binding protein
MQLFLQIRAICHSAFRTATLHTARASLASRRALAQNKDVRHSILFLVLLYAAHPGLPQTQRTPPAHVNIAPEDRIDINHATVEQLMKATGITRIWAERIVRFRPYRAKNELIDRGILPGQVYQRIKDAIIAHRDSQ